MKFADLLLRLLLLTKRDRDAISGDLLEEYREAILPTRHSIAARVWYARQVVGFVHPIIWGVTIGSVAGALQLIDTAIAPLADDSAGGMLLIVATLVFLWGLASYQAVKCSRRFRDALVGGACAGGATMAVIYVSSIVRVNVFLEEIQYRADWVNLVARFKASDFQTLRAYANYEYITGLPLLITIGAIAGAAVGSLGGSVVMFRSRVQR